MRVAFDSRPSAKLGRLGRYTRCLLDALQQTAPAGSEIIESHNPRAADVYHSPWMQGALLRSPCPMVVTIHDVSSLKRRSECLRLSTVPRLRHLAVQRADRVLVPTRTVAADAIARLELHPDLVTVIPQAPDPALEPASQLEIEAVRRRYQLPQCYLLSIGCMHRPGARREIAKLASLRRSMPLVLVGKPSPWARELKGVRLTGQIDSDRELAAIYSGAHALLLPFEVEGYGIAAVESLACGTPVAAFDKPAMRELLRGSATLVPPGDFESLISAAEQASRPAPAPPSWSWQDAAAATWTAYEQAISSGLEACVRPRIAGRRRQMQLRADQ